MDQLAVVTTVLVLSTVITTLDDFKRLLHKRGWFGGDTPAPAATSSPEAATDSPVPAATDLVGAMMDDLQAEDERRVSRAMSMLDKLPADRISPRLMQLLKHPKDEISARAARALLALGQAETLEPLYLYFNTRIARPATAA